MNVLLLITPEESMFYMNKHMPPLPVGILQSYLRSKNHNVNSIDLGPSFKELVRKESRDQWQILFEKDFLDLQKNENHISEFIDILIGKLLNGVNFSGVDFVGISAGTGISIFEIHLSLLMGKYIQQKYNIPVAFGGVNISHIYNFKEAFYELWIRIFKHIKYVFIGAGEVSFEKLVRASCNGNIDDLYEKLEGAVYIKNQQVCSNKESLPSLVCPDFDGFSLAKYKTSFNPLKHEDNIEQYFSWPYPFNVFARDINSYKFNGTNKKEIFFPYYFNYHCPYSCAFCGQSSKEKLGFCSKNAKSVLKDIEFLYNNFGAKYFHFVNNTFNYSVSFVKEFCEGIINKKLEIYWDDCARINNLTKKLLELMFASGCRKLVFGFETGSNKIQKYIKKRLDIKGLKQILVWCKEIGILCDLEVIIGFPYETQKDFEDTYNFLVENRDLINYFYVNRYYVDPNSLMGTNPEEFYIELHSIQDYSSILEKNKNLFLNQYRYKQENIELSNLHIFSFSEMEGRNWDEINETINNWFTQIYSLQKSFTSFKRAQAYLSN